MKKISVLLFVALIFTCSLTVADEISDEDQAPYNEPQTFHVYGDVDMVTTVKYQYGSNPNTFVKAVYPRLLNNSGSDDYNDTGDDNDERNGDSSIDHFNDRVVELINQQIDEFKESAKNNLANAKEIPAELTKRGSRLEIDYDTSFVSGGRNRIVSIRLTLQGRYPGNAHPFHKHVALNYNLTTSEDVELNDLFKSDTDYLSLFADYTNTYLHRHLKAQQLIASGTTPISANYSVWNIKPNGILITFDAAQVAPSIYGTQTVLIPYTAIKTIIAQDSPIARCISRKKACFNQNTLTGGFIDEAVNVQLKKVALPHVSSRA